MPTLPSLTDMVLVSGSPPGAPDAYPDGCICCPNHPYLSTSACAVYLRDMAPDADLPPSLGEVVFDVNCSLPGLSLQSVFCGPYTFSNRAESGGILTSLRCPFPVHIGTDSAFCTRRMCEIMYGPPVHYRKPWSLREHGDMWQPMQKDYASRGGDSVCVSKVKGHATDQDVINNLIAKLDRQGNHVSDIPRPHHLCRGAPMSRFL